MRTEAQHEPILLESKDVGGLLGLTPQRVRTLARDGTLRVSYVTSRGRLFALEDVLDLKAERAKRARRRGSR